MAGATTSRRRPHRIHPGRCRRIMLHFRNADSSTTQPCLTRARLGLRCAFYYNAHSVGLDDGHWC
jgi:hypothetical protein